MRPDFLATARADRQVGWIIGLCSLVFIGTRLPLIADQLTVFALWWTCAAFAVATGFVTLAAVGRWLPLSTLRVFWLGLPALTIVLQLTSYGALEAPEELLPWVWSLEPASVSILVLVLRARYALPLGILSGTSVAMSAWLFTGAVPAVVAEATPLHMTNVAFAVIFFGLRNRLVRFHESEAAARDAAERSAYSAAETVRRTELSRLVHDEVLSALTASLLFRGPAPTELRAEAAHALAVLDTAAGDSGDQRVSANVGADRLRRHLQRVDPGAEIELASDTSVISVEALTHVAAAMSEALRNARRHAQSTSVRAEASLIDGTITAVVRDDGRGFDPARAAVGRLGVADSIIGRVSDVGGNVEIISAPGAGTEVRITWMP